MMAKFETQTQAQALLEKIQAYWADRGYEVQGSVVEGEYNPRLRSTVYEVFTDLVAGLPKDYARRAA